MLFLNVKRSLKIKQFPLAKKAGFCPFSWLKYKMIIAVPSELAVKKIKEGCKMKKTSINFLTLALAGALITLLIMRGGLFDYLSAAVVCIMAVFTEDVITGVKKTGKGASHLLRRLCRNLAEGEGIWWILGLALYPIKIWYRVSRDCSLLWKGIHLVVIIFLYGYFLWRGYFVGYMTDKILYVVFMALTGVVDIFFN